MKSKLTLLDEPVERSFFPENFSNEIYYSTLNYSAYISYRSNFSIKYVIKGKESYLLDGKKYTAKEGEYLLVNNGRTIETTEDCANEAISIFLDKDLLTEANNSLFTTDEKLLENSIDVKTKINPEFFENAFSHADNLGKLLRNLHSEIRVSNHENFTISEEKYYGLAEQLIIAQKNVKNEIGNINKSRKVTREELYKRVLNAKDFIRSSITKPFNLESLARNTGLSKFHLIRVFKSAFGMTPHQYYILCSIEVAENLLLKNNDDLTTIACLAGFTDIYSFSKTFKKIKGVTPSYYRTQMSNI